MGIEERDDMHLLYDFEIMNIEKQTTYLSWTNCHLLQLRYEANSNS